MADDELKSRSRTQKAENAALKSPSDARRSIKVEREGRGLRLRARRFPVPSQGSSGLVELVGAGPGLVCSCEGCSAGDPSFSTWAADLAALPSKGTDAEPEDEGSLA